MKRISLLILVFVLGVFPLFSQIINVPGDQPSIQAAIEAASDDDTVLVAEGTYYENINFLGKAITVASHYIIGPAPDTSWISKTIIDGSKAVNLDIASVVTMRSGEDTTSVLTGFTIMGGNGTGKPDSFEQTLDLFIPQNIKWSGG